MDGQELVAEEAFAIVEAGGEIPEVIYYNAIYYLSEDPDGPGIRLTQEDLSQLKLAVVERYRRIILRDLTPENRDKSIYRGLARAIVNWKRLKKFCDCQKLETGILASLRQEVCRALETFLIQEAFDVSRGRPCSINCSSKELFSWLKELGAPLEALEGPLKTLSPFLMPCSANVINQGNQVENKGAVPGQEI
ncbi:hypothetical protein G4V39_03380 [Thermosulfuriphilus ammonigenes]|uniref:Uncharacterized protein n=1 Tax=Thermosulfuriphilus ammonigenes TaxID=1936021 RepID=A0A6G7PVB9_9BACT|nr:hypothetical protein [Thermosulfuriphilus ammonigenes]MBA2848476.1 hypothetical protein [Thermosulfuriphilus ammonigenes]QIJ71373.1 hypothetical protein G4V39_03380 [Thermosulfuriphilus ammonigenes]